MLRANTCVGAAVVVIQVCWKGKDVVVQMLWYRCVGGGDLVVQQVLWYRFVEVEDL